MKSLAKNSFVFDMLEDLMDPNPFWTVPVWKIEDPVQLTTFDDDRNYYVRAVIPGFKENELNIKINNRKITISGKKEAKQSQGDIFSSSRASFSHTYHLPQDSVPDNICAELKEGVLVVQIPKWNPTPEKNAKTIPIKVISESK